MSEFYTGVVDFRGKGAAAVDLVNSYRSWKRFPTPVGPEAITAAIINFDVATNPCSLTFEQMTTLPYDLGAEGTLAPQFKQSVRELRAVYFAIVHALGFERLIGSTENWTIQMPPERLVSIEDLIDRLDEAAQHYNRTIEYLPEESSISSKTWIAPFSVDRGRCLIITREGDEFPATDPQCAVLQRLLDARGGEVSKATISRDEQKLFAGRPEAVKQVFNWLRKQKSIAPFIESGSGRGHGVRILSLHSLPQT